MLVSFYSPDFYVHGLIEAEALLLVGIWLRGHSDLFGEHRLAEVKGKDECSGCELRWAIPEEVLISLHESAQLTGHISNLGGFFFVGMNSEDELVSLKEGDSRDEVHGELEGSDNLLFEGDEGLLGDKETLCVGKKSNHDVEGWVHWLFKFGSHQEASDSESNEAGGFVAVDSQVDEVSVGDTDSEHESIDLVSLVAV